MNIVGPYTFRVAFGKSILKNCSSLSFGGKPLPSRFSNLRGEEIAPISAQLKSSTKNILVF